MIYLNSIITQSKKVRYVFECTMCAHHIIHDPVDNDIKCKKCGRVVAMAGNTRNLRNDVTRSNDSRVN